MIIMNFIPIISKGKFWKFGNYKLNFNFAFCKFGTVCTYVYYIIIIIFYLYIYILYYMYRLYPGTSSISDI